MNADQTYCPECGSLVTLNDEQVISYHIRPDNLSACPASKTIQADDKPAPKMAARKTTKKFK